MHAELLDIATIQDNGLHNAFTTLATWKGNLWLAFREAATHGITPPGHIQIWKGIGKDLLAHTTIHSPGIDLRDPRFLATEQALYCMIGAYHPVYPATELRTDSAENLIRTYCTHTTDGKTWTPLVPILRPNYWGWSLIQTQHPRPVVYAAAYHTGKHGETSSLLLAAGPSPYQLLPYTICYDGSSLDPDLAPHYSPSEPVLFQPCPGALGCYVRTEGTMDLGVAVIPYQSWHWHRTPYRIHPSAVLTWKGQRLLVGRSVPEPGSRSPGSPWTGLWVAEAQQLQLLFRLPGGGDCAYPGIVSGIRPGEFLISYYAQDKATQATHLPGASIYLATVKIT